MTTIYVRCTLVVPIEIPDEIDAEFVIEKNGCPGTGLVGATIDKVIAESDKDGCCWACRLAGENKILTDTESAPYKHILQEFATLNDCAELT